MTHAIMHLYSTSFITHQLLKRKANKWQLISVTYC
jgi:hypothetical protein